MDDLALDGEGAAEDGGGAGHVAGVQGLAHGAGRQFQAADVVDPFGDRDREAQLAADAGQGIGRAGAALAVGEVEADRGVRQAEAILAACRALRCLGPAGEHVDGKGLVRHGGHGGVEGQEVEAAYPQRLQRTGHLAGRHQAEGGGVRLEPAARMRVEADDGEGGAEAIRGLAGGCDHGLMAPMDAIEGAERGGGAPLRGGQVAPVADDVDGHGLASIRPWRDGGGAERARWPRPP